MKALAETLKLAYAQFLELEVFTRFGAMVDERTQRTIEHGRRIRAILAQSEFRPRSLAEHVALLLAVHEGLLDDVASERIRALQAVAARRPWPGAVPPRLRASPPGRAGDEDRREVCSRGCARWSGTARRGHPDVEPIARLRARMTSLAELRDLVRAMRALAASHIQEAQASLAGIRRYAEVVEDAIAEAPGCRAARAADAGCTRCGAGRAAGRVLRARLRGRFQRASAGAGRRPRVRPGQRLAVVGRKGVLTRGGAEARGGPQLRYADPHGRHPRHHPRDRRFAGRRRRRRRGVRPLSARRRLRRGAPPHPAAGSCPAGEDRRGRRRCTSWPRSACSTAWPANTCSPRSPGW